MHLTQIFEVFACVPLSVFFLISQTLSVCHDIDECLQSKIFTVEALSDHMMPFVACGLLGQCYV